MQITINGERRETTDGSTVLALLETLGLSPQGTVVERNGQILDRSSFAETSLQEGDTLELVRFVGGG